MFSKEEQAEDIAANLAEFEETDVTIADVERWTSEAVCEWIEMWGFIWDSKTETWQSDEDE